MRIQKITNIIMAAAIMTAGVFAPAQLAYANSASEAIKSGVSATGGTEKKDTDFKAALRTVINTLMFIIGAVAVIMIVIAGLKMTASNGDPGIIKSARETILYAVIGLVVAILAWAIVQFIVSSLVK